MDELLAGIDFSKLAKAVSISDYASVRAWIERYKQHGSHHYVRSQISKIVRAAALDGKVTHVEYFRSYG